MFDKLNDIVTIPLNKDFLRNSTLISKFEFSGVVECYTDTYEIGFFIDTYEDKGAGVFYPVSLFLMVVDKFYDGVSEPLIVPFAYNDLVDNVHVKLYSSVDFDLYYVKEGDLLYIYLTDLNTGEKVLEDSGITYGINNYSIKQFQVVEPVVPVENVSFTLQDISDLIDEKNAILLQNLISAHNVLSLSSLNGSNGASFIDGAEVNISDANGVVQSGFDIWTVKSSHISMTDIARNLSTIIYVLENGERTMITPSMYVVKAPVVV